MQAKHNSIEVIKGVVGQWNTDIALGWDAGLQGKRRVAGKLFDRSPPEHFYEPQNHTRYENWRLGYEKAMRYRETHLRREVHYIGTNKEGDVKGNYKGWGIKRGAVVARLIKDHGCFGNVSFFYLEGAIIARSITCEI